MKRIILLAILMAAFSFSSCEKENSLDLSGTTWKSYDVDIDYEEYMLLKFNNSTYEIWYKDIGYSLYKEMDGIYSQSGNNVTLITEDESVMGVINNDVITFSTDGDIITFEKQ